VAFTLTATVQLPLRRLVLAELLPASLSKAGVTIVAGAALTALAAQVSIPIPGSPVPVTGQTFAVLLTAAALGPARGIAAQALYLVLGVIGLPVYAGAGHGPAVLFGATGGYLAAFLVAGAIAGLGARHGADRSPWRTLLLFAAASAVIYLLGTAWLCLDTGMPASAGIAAGVTPFLPGDAAKALLAAGLLPGAWRLAGGTGSGAAAARLPPADLGPPLRDHPAELEVVPEQVARVEEQELEAVAARPLERDGKGLLVDPAAEVVPVVDAGAAVVELGFVAVRQPAAEDGDGLGDRLDELVLEVAHPDEGHLECLAAAAGRSQHLGCRLERHRAADVGRRGERGDRLVDVPRHVGVLVVTSFDHE
jgi:biotin transport system substrate-specific component